MNPKVLRIIFIILCAAFLFQIGTSFADNSALPSGELQPGTASGKLSVNVQTFKMRFAYVRRMEKADGAEGATYLVLLTDRKFPHDLSKLTRFEIEKWMDRYDLHGISLGVDEHQNLIFLDVLRSPKMIIDTQYAPEDRKQGQVVGRIYTNGEVRYFRNRVKFDIKFNAKL
jgi:hypothetical protein